MMKSDLAIRAEGLGKRYQYGARQQNRTLRESLMELPKAAGRTVRNSLRRERREPHVMWALEDVSFEVKQGEVIGVIGANGAGKSTLLKVLSRITDPTTGYADMRGRVGSLLEVGTGFHPELTGRENIFLNGAILGMPREKVARQFDEIVDFSGVDKFVDTPVKRYSSGMYLRLAFGVAAHLEPEILLVDEVLAVGDAQFQSKCIGKMESVARDGRTVLFVSHNMAAIRSLCTRGLLLRAGRTAAQGDGQTVIEEYFRDLGILGSGDAAEENDTRTVFGGVTLNDGAGNSLDQSKPFELTTSFKLQRPICGFNMSVMFSDMRNQTLVAIVKTSEELGFNDGVSTDRHRMTVRFPPLWLNPGMYSVHFKMIVVGDASQFKHVSNAFPLDVVGTSSPAQAVLHPRSEWSTQMNVDVANDRAGRVVPCHPDFSTARNS